MTLSKRQYIAVEILIMAMIGLAMAFLGPFGTYAAPLSFRLFYWITAILIGYTIFRPINHVADLIVQTTGLPHWLTYIAASLVGSVPLALMIGFAADGLRFGGPMLTEGFSLLYFQVAAIGVVIFTFMKVIFGHHKNSEQNDDFHRNSAPAAETAIFASKPTEILRTRLHKRLPAGFPNDIIALGVEDHYVRVYAVGHSEMLLMRLRDAIFEMEPVEGLQVHRSWWVARDAIMTSKRDGRNLRLKLHGGLEIPVSRSFAHKLKQTGWI